VRRSALLITIVALASLGLAAPVLAAAPGSDRYTGRTLITAIPFSDSINTTEATTDADDVEANALCGAPATDASVWYEVTATSDAGLLVDTSGSDYTAGVIVATGSPGSLVAIACGPQAVSFSTTTGETYAILVFDDQGDGSGNGGALQLGVIEIPAPPVLDIAIASAGTFNAKTGSASIHGTLTCSGGDIDGKNFLDVQVTQTVGRFRISGEGVGGFACDGAPHPWSVETSGTTGKFGGGKASVSLYAFACGQGGCTEVQASATVNLKK
jgi:hypothetical protein